jgi:hypothetical protein
MARECRGGAEFTPASSDDKVTFKKAHPLAGTVFYDLFHDTGTAYLSQL